MRKIAIYGLKDPNTTEIRYVGKSIVPKSRFSAHLYADEKNPHKSAWIRLLREQGKRPVMVILEWVTEETWSDRERYWIKTGIELGWPLTNIHKGGLYVRDYVGISREDPLRKLIPASLRSWYEQLPHSTRWDLAVECAQSVVDLVCDFYRYRRPRAEAAWLMNQKVLAILEQRSQGYA